MAPSISALILLVAFFIMSGSAMFIGDCKCVPSLSSILSACIFALLRSTWPNSFPILTIAFPVGRSHFNISRSMIRTPEPGGVLENFEYCRNTAVPRSSYFDLNVYALTMSSHARRAGIFFLLLTACEHRAKYEPHHLDQAIDLALAHNHSIKATRTLILQNQAQEITANLRPNPTFGADSQFIPIFTPEDFSADDLNLTQQFDIGLSYLFERGHKRQRRLQAARDADCGHARPGHGCRAHTGLQCGTAIRQRAAGRIHPAVRVAGFEKFSGDGRHRPGPIQRRRHQRSRLSEDQAAASAVSDRRFLGPPGQSAGAGRTKAVARLRRCARRTTTSSGTWPTSRSRSTWKICRPKRCASVPIFRLLCSA